MDWLTAGLIAIGISVFVVITDKYVVSRVSPRPYTFLVGAIGLLSFLVFPFSLTALPTIEQWLYGSIIGILFSVCIYASFVAYQREEVSRLAPLSILSTILITIGAAVFFNERLTAHQYQAFFLFLIGALLLATRFETKMVFEQGLANFKIERFAKQVRSYVLHPSRTQRKISNNIMHSIHDLTEAAHDPNITWINFKKKLRFIKGLGWILLSIGIYIPYTLLAKELNTKAGVVNGFVSIRLGLFIGAAILMTGHWHELKQFARTKILAIGSIKEVFGTTANFLFLFAMLAGPTAIVQSLFSIESVGILVVSTILTRFGIIKESLQRRDLLQKGAGVAFIAIATVLLFI